MKQLIKFIGLFFKGIWKLITFIRMAIVNLFFILSIVFVYVVYMHVDIDPSEEAIKSALVLNLSGPIVEQANYVDPMDSITGSFFGQDIPKENVLYDIVDTLRYAKDDPNVTGLVLALSRLPETNLTKLRYIAKAINEFKSSGKPVYAAGDFYNQSQYYLASYADKVYLAPDGAVMLKGYSTYSLYYKSLLEKLNVNTHIFRVGTYKSAVEPFLRDDMSEQAKESTSRWLGQLWGAFSEDVAANRGITTASLNPNMEQFLTLLKENKGDLAALSLNIGLVDKLATRQQVRAELIEQFGKDENDSFNHVSYYDYLVSRPSAPNDVDDIAVVVASGAIMDGNQPRGTVGGDSVASLLRRARNDDNVKAVVLRVDSPGGSAFASEVIRNEIEALKQAGKPVVASMSSLAASGGYWISMSANKIVAQPTTLTGSIGIFSVITTFEKGLNELGVYTDGVGTSPFSDVGFTTGLSSGASEAIQLGIEHGYNRFTGLVSQNRNIPLEQIDEVAQGRVWTGQDALKSGLVDEIGDFDDAIKLAANLADIENYNIYWVEEPLSRGEEFIQNLMKNVMISMDTGIENYLPSALQPVMKQAVSDANLLNSFNDPKGHYAFCLNCLVK